MSHPPVPIRIHRSFAVSTRGVSFSAIALMAILAACTGSDGRSVDELVREGGLFLDPETMEPFSGLAFATLDARAGGVGQRLSLTRGEYDGPFASIAAERRLSSREIYLDGVKHGPYQWYFESGQLFEEGTYVEGRLNGPYRAYWETGELYEEGTYRGGDFDGPRRWFVGGRLIEVVTYRRGVIDGLYERYKEDGTLDLKGMLERGEPCGMWIEADRAIPYPSCGTRITD